MDSSLPLHTQLKEKLISAITEGTLKPGDQIPTQKALCSRFKMSHMTVRRALDELIREGVLRSVRGKGLYVTTQTRASDSGALLSFNEQIYRLGMTPSKRVLCAEIISASTVLAQMLKVPVGVPLASIERLLLADNTPVAITISYLPHSLCPDILRYNFAEVSLFATLRHVYGLQLSGAESILQAVLASKAQADLLQVKRPAALLSREQLTYLKDGTIIEFSRGFLRGDNYHSRIQEGMIPHLRPERSLGEQA